MRHVEIYQNKSHLYHPILNGRIWIFKNCMNVPYLHSEYEIQTQNDTNIQNIS